jgi:hypothetical protein
MKTKRIKPTVTVTLDSDVVEWLRSEAAKNRCTTSSFVNKSFAEKMEQEQAEKKMSGRSLKSQLAS